MAQARRNGTSGLLALPLLLVAMVALVSSLAGAEILYDLTYLGTGVPAAINSNGAIAGYAELGWGVYQAAVWTPDGTRQLLGTFGENSYAHGINDLGQVVGQSYLPRNSGVHAFRWADGEGLRDLGDIPGGYDESMAVDINNNGLIAGAADFVNAAKWDEVGGWQLIGQDESVYHASFARAVNNSGRILGYHVRPYGGPAVFTWDAAAGLTDLPSEVTDAWGMNDHGQVAGQGHWGGAYRAVLWDRTDGVRDLGDLPGGFQEAAANDLNDVGQVVGNSSTDWGDQAFVWDSGHGMRDLNGLTADYGRIWRLQSAAAINDAGWIVGATWTGFAHEAWLLKPSSSATPELSTWALLACSGLAGFVLRRRCKA